MISGNIAIGGIPLLVISHAVLRNVIRAASIFVVYALGLVAAVGTVIGITAGVCAGFAFSRNSDVEFDAVLGMIAFPGFVLLGILLDYTRVVPSTTVGWRWWLATGLIFAAALPACHQRLRHRRAEL